MIGRQYISTCDSRRCTTSSVNYSHNPLTSFFILVPLPSSLFPPSKNLLATKFFQITNAYNDQSERNTWDYDNFCGEQAPSQHVSSEPRHARPPRDNYNTRASRKSRKAPSNSSWRGRQSSWQGDLQSCRADLQSWRDDLRSSWLGEQRSWPGEQNSWPGDLQSSWPGEQSSWQGDMCFWGGDHSFWQGNQRPWQGE